MTFSIKNKFSVFCKLFIFLTLSIFWLRYLFTAILTRTSIKRDLASWQIIYFYIKGPVKILIFNLYRWPPWHGHPSIYRAVYGGYVKEVKHNLNQIHSVLKIPQKHNCLRLTDRNLHFNFNLNPQWQSSLASWPFVLSLVAVKRSVILMDARVWIAKVSMNTFSY